MKKKNKHLNVKKGDIVEVDWVDSSTPVNPWHSKEAIDSSRDEREPLKCKSVGYLNRFTDKVLIIYQSETFSEYGDIFTIPSIAVLSIKVIKRKSGGKSIR